MLIGMPPARASSDFKAWIGIKNAKILAIRVSAGAHFGLTMTGKHYKNIWGSINITI
jgi:hypothetical protein